MTITVRSATHGVTVSFGATGTLTPEHVQLLRQAADAAEATLRRGTP